MKMRGGSIAIVLSAAFACGGEFRFEERLAVVDAGNEASAIDATTAVCTTDQDCKLNSLHCLNDSECVECTQNSDCAGRPGGSFCRQDNHRCVQCGRDSDCKAGYKCEETSKQCIQTCLEGLTVCAQARTSCDDALCRTCERNADCKTGTLCNRPSGQCVECFEDSHCPSSKPKCALNYGVCVECLRARDCKVPGSVCNPDSNACQL